MSSVIRIEGISKVYRLNADRDGIQYRTFREAIVDAASTPWKRFKARQAVKKASDLRDEAECFWALRDVSFEVGSGEVVGIVGRNGAGKSTLLKILSRITEPTSGRAELRGRVGSLLEVGTGFHPELSGRENVYLNGAILGMSRREIARKFDEIVAFAEINRFLDTPVKRYSSGMYVRLAFAVAAHLEPEILIVDEVLAVGDMEFQKKCLAKMNDISRSGRTILFVSHNMAAVQNLCDKAVFLSKGRVEYVGPTEEALSCYLKSGRAEGSDPRSLAAYRAPHAPAVIKGVTLLDKDGESSDTFFSGDSMCIRIEYESPESLRDPRFSVQVSALSGEQLFRLPTISHYGRIETLPKSGAVRCLIPRLPLMPGVYTLSFSCKVSSTYPLDRLERAMTFNVEAADALGTGRLPGARGGKLLVDADWSFGETGDMGVTRMVESRNGHGLIAGDDDEVELAPAGRN